MIFLPPAGPNKGIDERLEPRTGLRERENGCPRETVVKDFFNTTRDILMA
jgi:hypothetical protein